MRDVTFGPEQTRTIWENEKVLPLLEQVYDRILIYGDPAVFDPIAAYGLSASVSARSRFCGYLAPAPPLRNPDTVRREIGAGALPLIVVSVGGGADGGALLRAYMAGLREWAGIPIFSYVMTGPLLPESDRQAVSVLSHGLPSVRIAEFDPDFAAAVNAADVVVSMGGYNSLTEAVYFGRRPIVAPRMAGPEEQLLRGRGFAKLGLATVVESTELNPTTIWRAIAAELDRTQPAEAVIPFAGLECIARELAVLAGAAVATLDRDIPTR
jgi:predicted glycosyltransferase